MRKLVVALTAILGLLILAGSFSLFLAPVSVLFGGMSFWETAVALVLSLLPAAASVVLALYLIRERERVATWYLPEEHDLPALPAESLLRVGLVLLGVYLVVQAIPELVTLLTSPVVNWLFFRDSFADESVGRWFLQNIPKLLSVAASLTIGFLLLAKREQVMARLLGTPAIAEAASDVAQAHCPNCGAGYDPADYEGGAAEPRCMTCKEPLGIPRS